MKKSETYLSWLNLELPPETRLVGFRNWVACLLYERLEFSKNITTLEKQIGQCEAIVMATVRELERRDFRLDGELLKTFIEDKIDAISIYQSKNQIHDLYAYFTRSWKRYIEQEADLLNEGAKTHGYHSLPPYNKMVRHLKTIPELATVAHSETLTGKMKRLRAQNARKEADDQQQTLF